MYHMVFWAFPAKMEFHRRGTNQVQFFTSRQAGLELLRVLENPCLALVWVQSHLQCKDSKNSKLGCVYQLAVKTNKPWLK